MKSTLLLRSTLLCFMATIAIAKDDTVSTAVFAKVGNGYKRELRADGTPKPEYYAISNGGFVGGTTRDNTFNRLTFADVANLMMPLLDRQGYHYAKNSQQATLLLVIHWGNTISYNNINYQQSLAPAGKAISELQELQRNGVTGSGLDGSLDWLDQALMGVQMEEMMRNMHLAPTARLLGYIDDINDNNDIRRYVGGQRYQDLVADVEESRYYVIVSAYDFREAIDKGHQKLLWVTRVSVPTPGNSFDESVAAMARNASKYFGQNTGKIVRGEELRGRVHLGDLEFLDAEDSKAKTAPAKKD